MTATIGGLRAAVPVAATSKTPPAMPTLPAAPKVPVTSVPASTTPFSSKVASVTPGRVDVFAYDARTGRENLAVGTGTPKSNDKIANDAYKSFTAVQKHFAKEFGRSGWDGKGAAARVVVHAPENDNASWDQGARTFYMGDGVPKVLKPLGSAKDVAAHEYTHAVVDSSVRLSYEGQQGGINESFADILATGLDKNYLIGETVYTPGVKGDALRDLEKPLYNNFKTLPKDVTEVHDLSGIPSLAAVTVAKAIGHDKMQHVWYKALTEHLNDQSGYAGAARATMSAAAAMFGKDAPEFVAVQDAWKAVGVNPRWTKNRTTGLNRAHEAFLASRQAQDGVKALAKR